jgi:hypothetical protein
MNLLQKPLWDDFQTHVLIAAGVLSEAVRRFAETRSQVSLQAVRLSASLLVGTVQDWRLFGFDPRTAVAEQPESVRVLVDSALTMFGEPAADAQESARV